MDPDKKHIQRPDAVSSREPDKDRGVCLRCGTCCQKGGPGLHQADRMLIEQGRIPSKYLYAIRKGERVYDNVRGCLQAAASDIIKIKGRHNGWTCIFFKAGKKTCTIYDDRPLECRVLKCWDTGELEQIYTRSRLTRQDLISQVDGLWDLVQAHQRRCDYEKIIKLIDDLNGPDLDGTRRQLAEIVQYDAEIRKLAVAKGGLDPAQLDFVFGRPLTDTLPSYGIRIRQAGGKTIITASRLSEDR